MVDEAYTKLERKDTEFILDILEHKRETSYMYKYMLQNFKEYEIENIDTRFRILPNLAHIFDWNVYLGICKQILKRKNSKHVMLIKEYMIDELIEVVSLEAEELMNDEIDEIVQEYKQGKSMKNISMEFIEWSLSSLGNLKEIYTAEQLEYIIDTIKANCFTMIDEAEIKEFASQETQYEQEEIKEDTESVEELFEKNLDREDMLHKYLQKNIMDEYKTKELWQQKDKWYIQSFLENREGLKLLTEFINETKDKIDNAVVFGEALMKYLFEKSTYIKYKTEIEKIGYEMLKMEETEGLSDRIINNNKQVINALLNIGILIKENEGIHFLNSFFVIYFGINFIKDKMKIEKVLEKAYEWQGGGKIIEIINMYSYTDLEEFNKECLIPYLKYLTLYVRKQDKYTIAKSIINKLEPTIYINKIAEYEDGGLMLDNNLLEYIGIRSFDNLMKLCYWKIKSFLNKNYLIKHSTTYKITLSNIIKDKEAVKQFNKIKIWDYLEKVYKKAEDILLKLQENPSMDAYCIINNKKQFKKYLDNCKKERRDKYLQ